jgi:hypothetical protein
MEFEEYYKKIKKIINNSQFELPYNDIRESFEAKLTPHRAAQRIYIMFLFN